MTSKRRNIARILPLTLLLVMAFAFIPNADASPARAQASPGAHASVVGGRKALPHTFPWMAYISIQLVGNAYVHCSGTVISPQVVLTAGHCVKDLDTGKKFAVRKFRVTTGSVNRANRSATRVTGVSRTVLNPGYDLSNGHGDAGLLILKRPSAAPAIPLADATDADLLEAGTPITFAGWGFTRDSARSFPVRLRWGHSVVQGSTRCSSRVSGFYPYFDESLQLCAVDTPAHVAVPCGGDSGGPAIARRPDGSDVEIGITDIVANGCSPRFPAIWVRVDAISDWAKRWTSIASQR